MKQLQHDTPSEILHIACQMGTEDCASRWQPVMTPNGICNVLYMNHLRPEQAESTLRTVFTSFWFTGCLRTQVLKTYKVLLWL